MAQLCLHIVNNFLRSPAPELYENMPYLSAYYWPVPISAKFRRNVEIPQKWANSAARVIIPNSAENCGTYPLPYLF